jgi:hypothetical protein
MESRYNTLRREGKIEKSYLFEPTEDGEDLSVKVSIELNELREAYDDAPSPDLLEKIRGREQLLQALNDYKKLKEKDE